MLFFAVLTLGLSTIVVIHGLFIAISPDTAQEKTGIKLNGPKAFIRALGIVMALVGSLGIWALSGFLS